MGKNIDEFKRFVEFVSNKTQTGNTITPTQFNEVANRAQMAVFERDYKEFLATKNITEFLSFFLKRATILIDSLGNGPYPSDYEHCASVRSYYAKTSGSAKEVEVTEETNFDFGKLQVSQLYEPTRRFPKYSHFGDSMRFLPKDLGTAFMDYFYTPPKPIWNYTVVSNVPVYSASGSVDFVWGDSSTNLVAAVYLSLISVNLSAEQLAGFSEMFKAQS